MNTQKSSILVLVSIIDLTICFLQNQMPLPLFEKNVLFQVYGNFERLNNIYVFEFYRAEVLLNFFVCCSSAYLGMFYRSLVGKSLY